MTSNGSLAQDIESELATGTATVMFADVAESVQLMAQDELASIRCLRAVLNDVAALCEAQYGGQLLERRGDSLLIRFDDPHAAVRAAHEFHERGAREQPVPIALRIGLHRAQVFSAPEGHYGQGLNLAARIASLANPGETIASAAVREAIAVELDAEIEDLGDCYVKHFEAPIRAFRLARPAAQSRRIRRASGDLRPAIAVIPPRARPASGEGALASQVFADCLIAALSHSSEFRLLSRLSTQAIGEPGDLPALAEHLGVDFVVHGTVDAADGRFAVDMKLTEARSNEVLWEASQASSLEAIVEPQGELIGGLADAIARVLLSRQVQLARRARLPTVRSYGLLLAGIGLLHRQQRSDFERSRQLFEALSERHPRHAAPYAWRAAWHVFRVTQGWFDDLGREASVGHDLSRRALEMDPDDALSLTVSGLVETNLRRDFDAAAGALERAIACNRSEPLAWLQRGALRAFVGDPHEAVADTRMARSLSPLDPWNYYFDCIGASAAFAAGDYAECVRLGQRSLRANCMHLSTLRVLAMAHAQRGDVDAAQMVLAEVLKIDPGLTVSRYLARSPSAGRRMAEICAQALRKAGLPE
jgi:class 3 adenylate cyclase